MDDTIEIVLENYRDWLGNKPMIYQAPENFGFHSANFSILTYQQETYQLLCTAGASKTDIPQSKGKFGKRKSCAYEYMIHAKSENILDFHEILFKVSNYAYLVNEFICSGSVIPFGEDILNSQMSYFYLTHPYENDTEIYSQFPDGQIILPKKIIQTLWVIPIYSTEADTIKKYGAENFDSILGSSMKDFGNLNRKSLV